MRLQIKELIKKEKYRSPFWTLSSGIISSFKITVFTAVTTVFVSMHPCVMCAEDVQPEIVAHASSAVPLSTTAPQSQQATKIVDHASSTVPLSTTAPQSQQATKKEFLVRVLLSELKAHDVDSWTIACNEGLVFNRSDSLDHKKDVAAITVSMASGEFRINGKRCARKRILIQPKKGLIKFGKNSYKGFFWLVVKEDRVQLINAVGIEDYVFAALRSEVWPSWKLEVYKVCAVAIRTYLISKIKESKGLYHIKCTNEHQTYFGHDYMVRDSEVIQRAVDETRGEFLTYKGKPIVAMYDSCCGGVVPRKIEGFDFAGHPYLGRSYACKYCKRCKSYSWDVCRSVKKWEEIFKKEFPKLGKIRAVKVLRRDAAGLVREVSISDGKHTFIITGRRLHSMGCSIRSCTFTVHKEGNSIRFKGKGVGHQMGLCQHGAHEMVEDGYGYRKILTYYYPGVEFAHLK